MTSSNLKLVLYFVMLGLILAGGFALLFDSKPDNDEAAWGMLGLIVGLLTREGAAILSSQNVATIAASAPTVTTHAGPPATVSVSPTPPEGD